MMPLTGQAKTDYQRDYMRRRQGTKSPRVGLITSGGSNNTGSNKADLETRLRKVGLNLDGNRILDALGAKSSPLSKESSGKLPSYNKHVSKTGDRVIKDGVEVVVPSLDADGNEIPD